MNKELIKALGDNFCFPGNHCVEENVKEVFLHCTHVSSGSSQTAFVFSPSVYAHSGIALVTYLDEPGFFVDGFLESGFIKIKPYGNVNERALFATSVSIQSSEPVYGLIGLRPIHLLTAEELEKPVDYEKLFVDTGLSTAMAKEQISIGDMVGQESDFSFLRNGTITGHGLSTKMGVPVLAKVAEELSCYDYPVHYIVAARNARGQGAVRQALETLMPKCTIVVDAISINKTEGDPEAIFPGKGPALAFGGNIDVAFTKKMHRIAAQNQIPLQKQLHCYSVNDVNLDVYGSAGGCPCVFLFLPVENLGMPNELVKMRDMECCAKLLSTYIKDMYSENCCE